MESGAAVRSSEFRALASMQVQQRTRSAMPSTGTQETLRAGVEAFGPGMQFVGTVFRVWPRVLLAMEEGASR